MKPGTFVCIVYGAILFACAHACSAQEVELKDKFGLWSVYCLKDAKPNPSFTKCSVSAGVLAKDNPDFWVKVAITANNPSSGDLTLTVRTPVLKFLRNGISLGFDGRQAVRGFIDSCSNISCESTIALDETLVKWICTRGEMSIQYQVSDDRSVSLILDLDQIVLALDSMGSRIGKRSAAVASSSTSRSPKGQPVRLLLERRTFERAVENETTVEAWKAPYQTCSQAPAKQVVLVKDLIVQNEDDFQEWIKNSKKCNAGAVAWIRTESGTSQKSAALDPVRLASFFVYGEISKSMPAGVVPEDGSHVAVFPAGTMNLTASSLHSMDSIPEGSTTGAVRRSTTGSTR